VDCECPVCRGDLRTPERGPSVGSPAFVAEAAVRKQWEQQRGLQSLLELTLRIIGRIKDVDTELARLIASLATHARYSEVTAQAALPHLAAATVTAESLTVPVIPSRDARKFDALDSGDCLLAPCSITFPHFTDTSALIFELKAAHKGLQTCMFHSTRGLWPRLVQCVQFAASFDDSQAAELRVTPESAVQSSSSADALTACTTPSPACARAIDISDAVSSARLVLQALGQVADAVPTLSTLAEAISAVQDAIRGLCGPDRINAREHLMHYVPPAEHAFNSREHAVTFGFGVIKGQISAERCKSAIEILRCNGMSDASQLANEYRFNHCEKISDSLPDPLSSSRRRMLSLSTIAGAVEALGLSPNLPASDVRIASLVGSPAYQLTHFSVLQSIPPTAAQVPHTDMKTSSDALRHAIKTAIYKPWSGLLALTHCSVDVWPGALVSSDAFASGVLEGRVYEPHSVPLEPGDVIYFLGDLFHGGSASAAESLRVHFEILHPECALQFPADDLSFVPHTDNLMWSVGPTNLEANPACDRLYF
jgi:hypothetical protein